MQLSEKALAGTTKWITSEETASILHFVEFIWRTWTNPTNSIYFQVTNGTSLSQLASLYSFFIEHHLVPNVLVEIYLLLELLTVKAQADDEDDDDDAAAGRSDVADDGIFSSVHNCVFFSTHVLKSQVRRFAKVLLLKILSLPSICILFYV